MTNHPDVFELKITRSGLSYHECGETILIKKDQFYKHFPKERE